LGMSICEDGIVFLHSIFHSNLDKKRHDLAVSDTMSGIRLGWFNLIVASRLALSNLI